mgnify:CR=1 FL=1
MALMGYAVKVILKVFFGILENTSLMVRFQKTLAGWAPEVLELLGASAIVHDAPRPACAPRPADFL